MRRVKRWWWLLLSLPILATAVFLIWATTGPEPMPEALAALQSDAQVEVQTEPWLVFAPVGVDPTTGLILYPGGRVDPRAYAPTGRAIAQEGYLVVVVPMPLDLAFFAPDRALEVVAAFPRVQNWAVGGHSLGGAMSTRLVYENPEAAQGLVLWAAYPAATDDLSKRNLAVASIYGTRDGVATGDKIAASGAYDKTESPT